LKEEKRNKNNNKLRYGTNKKVKPSNNNKHIRVSFRINPKDNLLINFYKKQFKMLLKKKETNKPTKNTQLFNNKILYCKHKSLKNTNSKK